MAGKILGGLFWGMIADKWKCHRLMSIVACLLSISCAIGQLGVSRTLASKANRCGFINLQENQNMTYLNSTTNLTNLFDSTINTMKTPTPPSSDQSPMKTEPFGILFLSLLILSMINLFADCSLEILNTGIIRKVQITSTTSTKRKVNYGAQRAFAPVGGTMGNIIANLSIQYFP